MSNIPVKIWNVSYRNGQTIKVATIESGDRKPSPLCVNCQALCCHGKIRPTLNSDEFLNKRFPMEFIEPEPWFKEQVPRAEWLAILKFNGNGECQFWDGKQLKCKVWPHPPKSCLSYDCREDSRAEMKEFAEKWQREWEANS